MLIEDAGLWGTGSGPYVDPTIRAVAEATARVEKASDEAFILLADIASIKGCEVKSIIDLVRENGLSMVGSGPSLAIRKWVALANDIL